MITKSKLFLFPNILKNIKKMSLVHIPNFYDFGLDLVFTL